jgi:peptidoglycan DL-endopeptidase CwlO
MRTQTLIGLGVLTAAAALWAYSRTQSGQAASSSAADLTANLGTSIGEDLSSMGATLGLVDWKNAGAGPTWVPVLNQVEGQYGLPADLLARMAYQESSFRESVIRGTTASTAGALGILQLEPAYFSSVRVPKPFTDADVRAQIGQAAQQMQSLYSQFGDWSLALAAYNAGAGNVEKYGGIPPFTETQNYVADITADVPALAGENA